MNKKLAAGLAVAGTLIGFGLGWYLGYVRPKLNREYEIMQGYYNVKKTFHMSDSELAEVSKKLPQYFEDEKRQDEMAASHCLRAYRLLAEGNAADARATLLRPVEMYYSLYHDKGGNPDLLSAVEAASKDFPEVAAIT